MKRIAIVGGGISGLSAAFALEQQRRAGVALEYVVYEASSRLGGVICTEHVEGCVVEGGPDSFLTEKPWASRLCRQLDIGDQLIASNDEQRKTYILVNGKLIPFPDGLMFLVPTQILPTAWSPLFSARSKLRMLRELFFRQRKSSNDESVASFIERHYGREMVVRLADPLLAGVYGGEASQLSVRAVLPRFLDMESKHGSLGRAMISSRRKAAKFGNDARNPIFTSLRNGMQQLVDAIENQLPSSSVRAETPVRSIQRTAAAWEVAFSHGTETFDGLILALPSYRAGALLRAADNQLADALESIVYSSSITVVLGYGQDVRSSLPPGFGFLVPHTEGKQILAATFVHNKFPYRAPPGRALLRCFLGGSRNDEIMSLSEKEIIAAVRHDLQDILGFDAPPDFARLFRWKHAMAQYNVGHLERQSAIEKMLSFHPGLALAGNAYHGIGVPDCIRSGEDAALKVMRALELPAAMTS